MKDREARQRQRVKNVQMGFWVILILIQMAVVNCLEVRAEVKPEPGVETESESGMQAEPEVKAAERRRVAQENAPTDFVIRQVQKDVVYENVEGGAVLPETLDIQVSGEGGTAVAVCSIQEKTVLREWWDDSFSFPVTFHSYDADYYLLGDVMVPYNEEQPELGDCEEQLLELIGVPPDAYEIVSLQWTGEAYHAEDGELCRDALGTGRKLVRDYRVRYSGTARIPAKPRPQTVENETDPQQTAETGETAGPAETEETVMADEAAPEEETLSPEEPEKELTLWQRITRTLLLMIGIGAILFFGGLVILAFLWVVKKLRKWYTGQKHERTDKRKSKEDQ